MFTKFKLLLTFFSFSFILPFSLQAEEDCDFFIYPNVTSVDCIANGTIEVILLGDDLQYMNDFLYRVYRKGEDPNVADLVEENIFTGLAEGTYTVEVTAFCSRNKIRVSKSQQDIEVHRINDYMKPDFKISTPFLDYVEGSRHSLPCYPTGAIEVFNAIGSKGPYTVRFSQYPPEYKGPVTLVEDAPYVSWFLFENLPGGTYEVELIDGCGGAQKHSITLETLSEDIPRVIQKSPIWFRREFDNCVGFTLLANSYDYENPYYYHYVQNRHKYYEYALYHPDEDDINNLTWLEFAVGDSYISIATRYTLQEMRADKNKLPQIAVRLKNGACNDMKLFELDKDALDRFSALYLIENQSGENVTDGCYPYDHTVFIPDNVESNSALCFPYSWKSEVAGDDGIFETIATGTNGERGISYFVEHARKNAKYRTTITDSDGYVFSREETSPSDGYEAFVSCSMHNNTSPCNDAGISLSLIARPGTTITFDPLRSSDKITPPKHTTIYVPIEDEYDPNALHWIYPYSDDWTVDEPISFDYIPNSEAVAFKATDYCGKIAYTECEHTALISEFKDQLPTLNIEYICGKARITASNLNGITNNYNPTTGERFDTDSFLGIDENSGPAYADVTYSRNRYISGTNPEDWVQVAKSGRYTFLISSRYSHVNSSQPEYYCQKAFEVDIIVPEMKVDQGTSAAYRCKGSPTGTGYIKLKVVGGSGNYQYTMYKRGTNTNPLATNTTGEFTSWTNADTDAYDIQIEDLTCGQTITHEVTVYNLNNATVGWPEGRVYRKCEGETLNLYSLALGETTYKWTGPNNWSSDLQNPSIPNLTAANSGTYTVEVGVPGCGPTETVKGNVTISVADKTMYWNPDATDNNWYNTDNWLNAAGDIAVAVPAPCTDVHIAGNSNKYPNLDKDVSPRVPHGFPACNNIIFHYGAETIFPHFLEYNKAFVQYNFNYYESPTPNTQPASSFDEETYPNAFWGDNMPAMQRSQWYMLSAPLKHITGGDFGLAGYPNTYQRLYNTTDPEIGKPAKDDFTASFSTQHIPLETTGHAMALWVPDLDPDYIGLGDHKYLDQLKGIMEMPYFQNPEIMKYRPLHSYNEATSTSSFQYYEYRLPTLEPYDQYDEYVRGDDAYRFVFETTGNKAQNWHINGNMVAAYYLSLPDFNLGNTTKRRIMIGNPLMCHIDFDKLYALNSGIIQDFYMVLDGASGTYQTYRLGEVSPYGLTNQIPPLQSFIVTLNDYPSDSGLVFALDGDDAVITADANGDALPKPRAAKANKNSGWLNVSASTPPKTGLTTTKGDVKTNATLRVNQQYTNIPKVVFPEGLNEKAEVFLIDDFGYSNTELVTTAYPEVVKLGLESLYNGDVTFRFSKEENTAIDKVILVDKFLEKSVDVSEKGAYVFKHRYNERNGVDIDRFELKLTYNVSGIAENEQNAVVILASQNGLNVESLQEISSVSLYNSLGQVVIAEKDVNAKTYSNHTAIEPGVYVANVILVNDFKPTTQKIIVQ